jgi:GDP-4-dehydro-6-deoxy-D-mannose reductase
LARRAAVEHGLGTVCVRAFNHTGAGQSDRFLVPAIAGRVAAAELRHGDATVTVGNLDPVRDFSDVRDVVRAYRLLAVHGDVGAVYNVCSGRGVAIGQIVERLLPLAAIPLRPVVDAALVRSVDVPVNVGNPARLAAATGWRPEFSLDDTLAAVLAHARDQVT